MSKKYSFIPGFLPLLMVGALVLLTLLAPVPAAHAQAPEGEAMGDKAMEGGAMKEEDKAMAGDAMTEDNTMAGGATMEDNAMAGGTMTEDNAMAGGTTMEDKAMTGQASPAMLPVTGAPASFPVLPVAAAAAGLLLLGGGIGLSWRRR